jgi:hypothetical protein
LGAAWTQAGLDAQSTQLKKEPDVSAGL